MVFNLLHAQVFCRHVTLSAAKGLCIPWFWQNAGMLRFAQHDGAK